MENEKVAALIIGHPGHELAIHHWVELNRPRVFVLTDGSGGCKQSRLNSTTRTLHQAGATLGSVYGRFTDKEFYRCVLEKRFDVFLSLVDEIVDDLSAFPVALLTGDSSEGHSSTHDICRLMVGAVARKLESIDGANLPNYSFPLFGTPKALAGKPADPDIRLHLDDSAWARKTRATELYAELQEEYEGFAGRYGKEAYQKECLWLTDSREGFDGPPETPPFYETFGKKRVEAGLYPEVIRYESHIKPLADALWEHAEAPVNR